MGKLILYGVDGNPTVRACLLTLKTLQLPYEYRVVNQISKNLQDTVPTLEDDGNIIWDSHAIVAYLVSKYAKDDKLYPKDFYQRAVINQRLHYDSSVIFRIVCSITDFVILRKKPQITQDQLDAIIEVYEMLETLLKNYDYIAGKHLTIADFSLVATVSLLAVFYKINANKYIKLHAWLKRLEQLPFYAEIFKKC